jgi:hypothetical protein
MAGGEGSPRAKTVMLNSFQHPFRLPVQSVPVEKWTLKQVQGDEFVIQP